MEGSATMALNSQDCGKHERDKLETELSARAHCNGLVMSQSNVDSASMEETAHDWEAYKKIAKDFFDDGTITFFWYLCDILSIFKGTVYSLKVL